MLRNPFLEKDISNVILDEDAIFNGTSHPINLVKSDWLKGRGKKLRIAKGRPFEIKEISVTRKLYIRDDNFEFESGFEKILIPNIDFEFGKISNEESERYRKIVVSKKYAENIKNIILFITRKYGPFSPCMFNFISHNQFIRKLYFPYDRVEDEYGNLIGCSRLEKAVILPFENFEWIFNDYLYGGNFYNTLTEDEKILISLEYKKSKNNYLESLYANQCPVIPMYIQQNFLKREYFINEILFAE